MIDHLRSLEQGIPRICVLATLESGKQSVRRIRRAGAAPHLHRATSTSYHLQGAYYGGIGWTPIAATRGEPQRGGHPAAVCETQADETHGVFPQGPLVTDQSGSYRANIAGVDDTGELRWHS